VRPLLSLAVFAVVAWFLAVWIPPRMAAATVPESFTDQSGFRVGERYALDVERPPRTGDIVAVRLDADTVGFARVHALPGQRIRLRAGALDVDDRPVSDWSVVHQPIAADLGPVVVPAGHLWLGTTGHRTDSLARGPIPRAQVLGIVGDPP
jgi:hypothetical protein